MTCSLFLDANVFLSFYLFGKDDLEEMAKVVKLIGDEEITLLSNAHLVREVQRRREGKIAEGFNALKSANFGREFPHYCNDYSELPEIKTKLKEIGKLHAGLVAKATADIEAKTLKADVLINGLFDLATDLPIDEGLYARARRRLEMGEPPGKTRSIGDAIHWETLKAHSGTFKLNLVSLDSDFSSPLNASMIDGYLEEEWKSSRGYGSVTLFRSLSDFFKAQFPSIELSVEFEKDELVSRLKGSPNFAETHEIIGQLAAFEDLTRGQIRGVFEALTSNNQVGWIGTDPDVNAFFRSFKDNAWFLNTGTLEQACELLEIEKTFFNIPF